MKIPVPFKRSGENEDCKPDVSNDFLSIYNTSMVKNIFSIYLHEEIAEQRYYKDLFNLLRTSDEQTSFVIYLNNFGGMVHTGLDIINAMKACRGELYTVVTGPIYSMAPLIALQAQQLHIEPHSGMMFHDYSGGSEGKGSEQRASITFHKDWFDGSFRELTQGFLTKKEQTNILNGSDLYLNSVECKKRLEKLKKLYKPQE